MNVSRSRRHHVPAGRHIHKYFLSSGFGLFAACFNVFMSMSKSDWKCSVWVCMIALRDFSISTFSNFCMVQLLSKSCFFVFSAAFFGAFFNASLSCASCARIEGFFSVLAAVRASFCISTGLFPDKGFMQDKRSAA